MPAISKGVVYASANNSTNLTCVNVADGSVISEIALGGSSPAVANDTLYTAFNGVLYAYSHIVNEALSVDKANAKILLTKDNKDNAKLSASIPMTVSPTNWLDGALTLKVGDIVFLANDTGEMKISDKKVTWNFTSSDKSAKTTLKWIAKKQVMQIKASVKKSNLQNTIPYTTVDGTETSDITSILRAGDYDFYAKSVDSMTTETKKEKVKLKYKK